MAYQALKKTGQEPEYKKSPPLKVSSIGTENTKKSAQMPDGSALLTDTGKTPNELKNQEINYIIHAVPRPRGNCASDEEFIEVAVKAAQNSIFLAEHQGIKKLALCFIAGLIYRGTCPPEKLAEALIMGSLSQIETCHNLQEIIFVAYKDTKGHNEPYLVDAFKKVEKDPNYSTKIHKAKSVSGDICNKSLHGAEAIVNSENAQMSWGGGISGAIKKALGDTAAGEVDAERKGLMNKFNSLIEKGGDNNQNKYTCPQCGKEYNTKDRPPVDGKYCSQTCREAAEPNETKTCAFCHQTIDDNVTIKQNGVPYHPKCFEEYLKKKKEGPTDNLSQIRTQAFSAIQQALNLEPKITNSDLLPDYQNWEKDINQTNSEGEINVLKKRILQDIQVKRTAKQEAAALDEKINSARTETEKVDLFKEVGKKLGEETPEQTAKLEQIKNELAANPTQLRTAIQHEITAQMTAFEVKTEDLSSNIRTQLESLKNEQNAAKIREIEKVLTQAVGETGVKLKISRLGTRITDALRTKNQTEIKALKTQLFQFISSPNTFYQAQKSQFQALLAKLEKGENQNQNSGQPSFPWKIVIPVSLAAVVGIIGLVLTIIFRKKRRKFNRKVSPK